MNSLVERSAVDVTQGFSSVLAPAIRYFKLKFLSCLGQAEAVYWYSRNSVARTPLET